jgi:glycosyltransferase involved in cell wall biosynthesis
MADTKQTPPSLTVVVTAYNEEKILEKTFASALKALEGVISDYEIILIDDASKDSTPRIIDRLAAAHSSTRAIHNEKNINQGGCYKKSIPLATKEYHCLLPGDDMVSIESLRKLLASTGEADMSLISIDNREIRHGLRRLISQSFVQVLNLLFGYRLQYYNGPVIIKTSLLREIEVSTSFMFISDSVIKLLDKGASYVVIPLRFNIDEKAANMRAVQRNLFAVFSNILCLYWEVRISRFFRKSPCNIKY